MRMQKIQQVLKDKMIEFQYVEEDGLGSLDFEYRGLRYHIWEFCEGDTAGAESNIRHAGRSEDFTGDYDQDIASYIQSW